jgi:putative membrane protein
MTLSVVPPAVILSGCAALYLSGVIELSRRNVRWSYRRLAAFLAGLCVIAVALFPPIATHDEFFPIHVVQHLLLGMAAPLLLALSSPMTLLLRVLPPQRRRTIAQSLQRRVVHWLTHPIPAALLAIILLYILYLTPLYALNLRHPLLHEALHAHVLLAGYLFTWSLVGLDPAPRRASFRLRTTVLVFALAAHGTLAKLMYVNGPSVAGLLATGQAVSGWRLGAQLMWYGGDVVNLALVIVFFHQWYMAAGRHRERIQRQVVPEEIGPLVISDVPRSPGR